MRTCTVQHRAHRKIVFNPAVDYALFFSAAGNLPGLVRPGGDAICRSGARPQVTAHTWCASVCFVCLCVRVWCARPAVKWCKCSRRIRIFSHVYRAHHKSTRMAPAASLDGQGRSGQRPATDRVPVCLPLGTRPINFPLPVCCLPPREIPTHLPPLYTRAIDRS